VLVVIVKRYKCCIVIIIINIIIMDGIVPSTTYIGAKRMADTTS